jgi:hypothetical protein
MQPEVPMPGKIQIWLYEKHPPVPFLRSQLFDELELDARRQGAEVERQVIKSAIQGNYDLLMIGLVGAASTAVFARNVIGIAKDWIELTKNTKRSVRVKIGDKEVEIKQGDDIRELLQKYFPDDGTSNPL